MNRPWYTTAFGAHYPLLYRHRDRHEARRCLELLPRLAPLPRTEPLLDLGCGDGRHLEFLLQAGHAAVGLDLSGPLLAAAREKQLPPGSLIRGDMRGLPFADGCLGGVLSLFTAFGYFGPLADNLPVVREIARVLKPGRCWFLDYVDCDSVRRELGAGPSGPRRRQLECLEVTETRRLDGEGTRVLKDVKLTPITGRESEAARWGVGHGGVSYTESVALFRLQEIRRLALGTGLVQVAGAGDYDGTPLGRGSRWIMVFRKGEDADPGTAGPGSPEA